MRVDAAELRGVSGKFDYIVAAGIIERSRKPEEMLAVLKEMLKASGKLLDGAGWEHYMFYSVMPEITRPQILLAEDYIPNERLGARAFPNMRNTTCEGMVFHWRWVT